jgi:hypothetical protein
VGPRLWIRKPLLSFKEGTLNEETADSDEEDTPPRVRPRLFEFQAPFSNPC